MAFSKELVVHNLKFHDRSSQSISSNEIKKQRLRGYIWNGYTGNGEILKNSPNANLAHLVERRPSKSEATGSSPVIRSGDM